MFLCLVGYQIFLPPVTGLANNSDFMKALGGLALCAADHETQNNQFLVTDFLHGPDCYWPMGIISTEVPLAWLARHLSTPLNGSRHFDLRYLGGVHFAVLLLGFGIVLALTRRAVPLVRFGIPPLFILIFSDIAYTGYLNSAYMDAPAMVLLIATTAIAIAACVQPERRLVIAGYLVLGIALACAKSQHAVLGLFFAAIAVLLALRPLERRVRTAWVLVAVLLAGSTVTMYAMIPPTYHLYEPLFSVIFSRLAIRASDPGALLKELGLSEEDLRYVGSNAYTPHGALSNDLWREDFVRRTSLGKVAAYYLRHPDVTLRELNFDLVHALPVLRPTDMANYRQKDGFPPRTMATRFSLWSNLRSEALMAFPYHVILIFLLPWAVAAWQRYPWTPVMLTLSAAGILEYPLSTLADALDTARHLFLFQVITELLILLLAATFLTAIAHRLSRSERAQVVTEEAKL